jgi:hypothetical protein
MAGNHQELVDVGDDIFVYTGGRAPRDVRRAKIDDSINTIPCDAFRGCEQLIEVEGHIKLKKIEEAAFLQCPSLIKLTKMGGVVEIECNAFKSCEALSDLEFGKLEIIGNSSFCFCKSLRSVNMPSVRRVGVCAFAYCKALTEAVFGEDLERIDGGAFNGCTSLRRIAIPLKDNLIISNNAFYGCKNLSMINIVGEIHETISSLHLGSWKNEMKEEIERINQTLPETYYAEKTPPIQRWIRFVQLRIQHYKIEHHVLVKEAVTLLELALWKAKLLNEEGMKCEDPEEKNSKKSKIDVNCARKEHRVTSGANIVIKNVLPFLVLK